MKTSDSTVRLHGLDTLRAFAIAIVVLYHLTIFGELPERILPLTRYGWMGVDLFFVLSGFLIGQQLLKSYASGERPSIVEFYRRRAYRILPAYLVVVAVYFMVPAFREYPTLPPLWKLLTFTQNLGFTFATRCFSHAWSLCVEEHFYLVLPLLVAVMMRKPSAHKTVAVLVGVVVFGIVLRAVLLRLYPDDVWPKIYYPSYTRLDGLVMGVALALVRTFRPAVWAKWMLRGHVLFFSGVACVVAVMLMLGKEDLGSTEGSAKWALIVGWPLLTFGFALLMASSMSRDGWLARWRVPGAETFAMLAFSLYLTHKAVAHFVMVRFSKITLAQGPSSWVLYVTACGGVALVLHFGVERPFLWLRDR